MNLDPTISILLIEDDIVDVKNIKYGFNEHHILNNLIIAQNGEEALDLLLGRKNKKRLNPLPVMILLDINMPRVNGFEFLRIIRSDTELKKIPVIITTTSESPLDKKSLKDFNVVDYFVKPLDFTKFLTLYNKLCKESING